MDEDEKSIEYKEADRNSYFFILELRNMKLKELSDGFMQIHYSYLKPDFKVHDFRNRKRNPIK